MSEYVSRGRMVVMTKPKMLLVAEARDELWADRIARTLENAGVSKPSKTTRDLVTGKNPQRKRT